MSETHAVWSGSFRIFGVDVKCHVLSDGSRIVEADSMVALLNGDGAAGAEGELEEFTRWQKGER